MRKTKKGSNELVRVYFFNRPGAGNTSKVIDAVKRRLRQGDVNKILVASESGRLALALKHALGAGATSVMEPADQFYGDRNAGVKDASGNIWWIATHIEDVSPQEIHKRWEARVKQKS